MKIVIDISKSIIEHLKDGSFGARIEDKAALVDAVMNGTPLPKGHGDLVDRKDLIEDFKDSKKISFAERMDISCIVDHAQTIIEADTESEGKE